MMMMMALRRTVACVNVVRSSWGIPTGTTRMNHGCATRMNHELETADPRQESSPAPIMTSATIVPVIKLLLPAVQTLFKKMSKDEEEFAEAKKQEFNLHEFYSRETGLPNFRKANQARRKTFIKRQKLLQLSHALDIVASTSPRDDPDMDREEFVMQIKKEVQNMITSIDSRLDFIESTIAAEKSDRGYNSEKSPDYKNFYIDWTKKGFAVPPIRRQGPYDCWAFAVIEAIEFLLSIKRGELSLLAVQELLDCDKANSKFWENEGGSVMHAYRYVLANGISYQADYPYTGEYGCDCRRPEMDTPIVRIQSFQKLEKVTNKEMCKRLAIQPFTVVIWNCDHRLDKYRGGTFKATYDASYKNHTFNHAGLLVGRGIDSEGIRYWKIRCANGEHWGEDGHFHLAHSSWESCKGAYQIMQAAFPIL
ncbi:hypothetical protein ABFS82_14G269100 [Erythranthe guttata]